MLDAQQGDDTRVLGGVRLLRCQHHVFEFEMPLFEHGTVLKVAHFHPSLLAPVVLSKRESWGYLPRTVPLVQPSLIGIIMMTYV